MNKLLDKYAELVVRTGVNIRPDQLLVINASIENADFARRLAKAAFGAGAHDVTISWHDEQFSLLRYMMGKKEVFTEFPDWRRIMYMDNAEEGAAFISIVSEDPEIFKSVEPERLTLAQQAAGAALKEYRERIMSNRNSWCVVSVPSPAWAACVFPELSAEEAVNALWQNIFAAVRVNNDCDAVKAWKEHTDFLGRAADFLNKNRFKSLHYINSLGTDLTVGLPDGHIWAGGAEKTTAGTVFVANMPTEEVYTAPALDDVNGVVYASKPLVYNGNLIKDFYLRFENGKVTDFAAKEGEPLLRELLSTDQGSCRLGEVALVPYDSPISRSGVLFYNTLFDENASCHLAFGKAYPTCLEGGTELTEDELLQRGINNSLIHEDFMIGTADLSIDGITAEGSRVPVFRQGNFVSL